MLSRKFMPGGGDYGGVPQRASKDRQKFGKGEAKLQAFRATRIKDTGGGDKVQKKIQLGGKG